MEAIEDNRSTFTIRLRDEHHDDNRQDAARDCELGDGWW